MQAEQALQAITDLCANKIEGNLLDLSVNAARARCSVGEITDAMETVTSIHLVLYNLLDNSF